MMEVKGTLIEDTYCEAFDGLCSRLMITALDEKRVKRAAYDSTALPCTVFGEAEGGVEKFLSEDETPDGRPGAIIQLWVGKSKKAREQLEYELGKRIRQGILVVPTSSVYNALDSDEKFDTMFRIGNCGDGYEFVEEYKGRTMINVPIMMGAFRIEKEVGIAPGIMGGNLWFMCDSEINGLKVCDIAGKAVEKIEGVVASFREGCSAGSKAGGKYEHIGPSTNHPFCPTLKGKISDFEVPDGVESIPEIVLNGLTLENVKEAMASIMKEIAGTEGLIKISAGNYGGKLGRHHIQLKDLA
ncbi:MAG: formylmethanofuran--tetrahydromethanopterin N-formyltransferase [Candidatus Altiarchaeota archaeon]